MNNDTPAKKAYNTRKDNVQRMMSQLSEIVADHSRAFRNESSNWGYVGEIGYVEEQLQDLINFLQSDKE